MARRHFTPGDAAKMARDDLIEALADRLHGRLFTGNGWGWRGMDDLPEIPELRERIEREAQAAREFR